VQDLEAVRQRGPRHDQVAAPGRRLRSPELLAVELGAAAGGPGDPGGGGEGMMERGGPAGERSFGVLDHAALWGSLGVTLYMMPFGSLLVPALSIEQAFAAVGVGALLGALLLAGGGGGA